MKHCEKCKWFGGYIPDGHLCRHWKSIYGNPESICSYYERKNMNIKEAYKVMQAAWVKLYNVEVDDVVRTLRYMKTNELGCDGTCASKGLAPKSEYVVSGIETDHIRLTGYGHWPFFCLEFVKKAEPVIEITVKVNGEVSTLKTLSKETLLNIREKS